MSRGRRGIASARKRGAVAAVGLGIGDDLFGSAAPTA